MKLLVNEVSWQIDFFIVPSYSIYVKIRGLKSLATVWSAFVHSKKSLDQRKRRSCYNSHPNHFKIMAHQLLVPFGGVMVYFWGKFIVLLSFGGRYHNSFTDRCQYSISVPWRNLQELLLVLVLKATMVHWNKTWTWTSNYTFVKALRVVKSGFVCSIKTYLRGL